MAGYKSGLRDPARAADKNVAGSYTGGRTDIAPFRNDPEALEHPLYLIDLASGLMAVLDMWDYETDLELSDRDNCLQLQKTSGANFL